MQEIRDIRDRILPMLELVKEQYEGRVQAGYPVIVDDTERGMVGVEFDSSYALYITQDDTGLYAEVYRRLPRIDNRATAQRQKYGGAPLSDRRPLPENVDDQTLRNLIAEVKNYVNYQPGMLWISDD